jgi:hypothetical protein
MGLEENIEEFYLALGIGTCHLFGKTNWNSNWIFKEF